MNSASSDFVAEVDKRHILLVEDDEATGAAYSKILRAAGYDVSVAMDFRLALEILEAERPLDLLLIDIVMPGSVNGLALARMARMRRKNLKVIYMTGYSIPGAEREVLGPILFKPIDDARLIDEIKRVLQSTDR